jgi:lysophospholipase L1-like esterase
MNTKNKKIAGVGIAILILALGLIVVFSQNLASTSGDSKLARVACLGDSITELTGYPEDLQKLMGNASVVCNFGFSGSTVIFDSTEPYFFEHEFKNAKAFGPTTVIIMLGTNDAHPDVYSSISDFVPNYEIMIRSIQAISSKPQIFLVEPPPIFNNTLGVNIDSYVQGVIPRIQEVANQTGVHLIDVYTPLLNHPEYFTDGLHPNSDGAKIIANIIYKAITSNSS